MKKLFSGIQEDNKKTNIFTLSNESLGGMDFILNYPKIEDSRIVYLSFIRGFIIDFDLESVKDYEGEFLNFEDVLKNSSFKAFKEALQKGEIRKVSNEEIERIPEEYRKKAEEYQKKFIEISVNLKEKGNYFPIPICLDKDGFISRVFRVIYSKVMVNYSYLLDFITTFKIWSKGLINEYKNIDFYWDDRTILIEFDYNGDKVKYVVAQMIDEKLEKELFEGRDK